MLKKGKPINKRNSQEVMTQLKNLSDRVGGFLLYMDSLMDGPPTKNRIDAIAGACNQLDLRMQQAERFQSGTGLWRSKAK